MLIRRAEVEGLIRDVRIAEGRIEVIAERIAPHPGEGMIDAEGGALFPGLHDHHIHLFALAAALGSVACGPPSVWIAARSPLRSAPREENSCEASATTNRSQVHLIGGDWMPWSPTDLCASSTEAERFGC